MNERTQLVVTDRPARPVADRGRRRLALAVLAGSHLVIVVDATIVNVALSAIQGDLAMRAADLQWVVTAYTLAFGGLLLLGGRLADRLGRRRMFLTGASLFAGGALLAGGATSPLALVAGRALQGAGSAVLTPAALSLLMVVFAPGPGRDRALGVWASVASAGSALGLVLGGILTQVVSWRWVFWVNVPIAGAAVVGALAVLPKGRAGTDQKLDATSALLATAGLVALVYGLVGTAAEDRTVAETLLILAAAAALLAGLAWRHHDGRGTLVPSTILGDRGVIAASVIGLLFGAAIYALFYFLSLFMGGVLGYAPVQVGVAFLPTSVAIAAGAALAGRSTRRVGLRPLILTGTLLTAAGLASLGGIDPATSYLTGVLPGLVGVGLGLGMGLVALTSVAVGGVAEQDSGVASGVFNTSQQIGGALGVSILTTLSTAWTLHLAQADPPEPQALTAGWSLAFVVAAGLMLAAALVTRCCSPGRDETGALPGSEDRRPPTPPSPSPSSTLKEETCQTTSP